MKRKALRVRSEGNISPYVTEAESRKQHSDSPLCNSLQIVFQRWKRKFPRLESFWKTYLLPNVHTCRAYTKEGAETA